MKKIAKILLLIIFGCVWVCSPLWAAEKKEITFGYSTPITGAMANVGEKN